MANRVNQTKAFINALTMIKADNFHAFTEADLTRSHAMVERVRGLIADEHGARTGYPYSFPLSNAKRKENAKDAYFEIDEAHRKAGTTPVVTQSGHELIVTPKGKE
jgi:hypothetical protein